MFTKFGSWFRNLSQIGKVSAVSTLVLGGLFVAGATSPAPNSSETTTPDVQQQSVKKPTVTTKVETESQPIAFESQTVEDGAPAKGQTQLRTTGVNGVKTITHTITLTDGVETDRQTSEQITTAPVTQVTAIGTYVAPVQTTPAAPTSTGVVKMSRTGICHAPGTTYYNQTKHYTSYDSLDACLGAGGRMPKR